MSYFGVVIIANINVITPLNTSFSREIQKSFDEEVVNELGFLFGISTDVVFTNMYLRDSTL